MKREFKMMVYCPKNNQYVIWSECQCCDYSDGVINNWEVNCRYK